MYSGCGVIISKVRNAEDELNTLAAATITGLAYKSTGLYQRLHLVQCSDFFSHPVEEYQFAVYIYSIWSL